MPIPSLIELNDFNGAICPEGFDNGYRTKAFSLAGRPKLGDALSAASRPRARAGGRGL